MKTIKFRGKRIDNGEWVYGFYTESYGKSDILQSYITSPHNKILNKYHEVRPETVGQFTGLTDKNGVEIFEGDTLNYKRHIEQNNWASPLSFDKDYEVIVGFENGMFIPSDIPSTPLTEYIKDNTYGATGTCWEITGNIHDKTGAKGNQ